MLKGNRKLILKWGKVEGLGMERYRSVGDLGVKEEGVKGWHMIDIGFYHIPVAKLDRHFRMETISIKLSVQYLPPH